MKDNTPARAVFISLRNLIAAVNVVVVVIISSGAP